MNILLVDDDANLRNGLHRALSKLGYEARTAPNGEAAWAVIQTEAVDLVILDWQMPVMDGIRLLKLIRSHPPTEYLYVIMLTGRRSAGQQIEGLHAGADDYLTKPFEMEDLLSSIRTAERILFQPSDKTRRLEDDEDEEAAGGFNVPSQP